MNVEAIAYFGLQRHKKKKMFSITHVKKFTVKLKDLLNKSYYADFIVEIITYYVTFVKNSNVY